jgi:hypothetical protein
MNTFSLLQLSLDQKIERHAFEDASTAVASVARADCAMLHRDLYGIVVSHLAEDEALAFQAELARRDYPTAIVADSDLPVLHESFQIQHIECREEALILTDSMGHQRVRPLADLRFLAAGFINRLHFKSEWDQHLDSGLDSHGAARLVTERELHEETELEFRLDLFFKSTPERQHAILCKDSMIYYQGDALLLRDTAGLIQLSGAMADLLPPERVNTFLRHPQSHPHYPGLHGYEEEILWYFHRLGPST